MSYTPALDEARAKKIRDSIELCGKNRGPHNYIPVEWKKSGDIETVSRLLCTTCLCNINTSTLIKNYQDLSIYKEF